MAIKSINPYTGELQAEVDTINNDELDTIIDQAHDARLTRQDTPKRKKKELFLRLADLLEQDIDHHAKLQTIEMGMLYGISKK